MVITDIASKADVPVIQLSGLDLISQQHGIKIVNVAETLNIRILGIERFLILDNEVQPDMGGILDLSDTATVSESALESIEFLRTLDYRENAYVEFVFDE